MLSGSGFVVKESIVGKNLISYGNNHLVTAGRFKVQGSRVTVLKSIFG